MGTKKNEAKEYAKMLFLDTSEKHSIKQIAERIGVTPITVSKWIKQEDWEKLRKSLMVTREKMIGDLYDQLEWLNDDIKSREIKVASFKEAQQITMITNSINKLETETSIAEVYQVATDFIRFLKIENQTLVKPLLPLFDAFVKSKL